MPRPLPSIDLPRAPWAWFARLDAQPLASQGLLGGLLLGAWYGLAFGVLRALGHTAWAVHLGPVTAVLVLVVGLLHRRWYTVERPRWWAQMRARLQPVAAPPGVEDDSSFPQA